MVHPDEDVMPDAARAPAQQSEQVATDAHQQVQGLAETTIKSLVESIKANSDAVKANSNAMTGLIAQWSEQQKINQEMQKQHQELREEVKTFTAARKAEEKQPQRKRNPYRDSLSVLAVWLSGQCIIFASGLYSHWTRLVQTYKGQTSISAVAASSRIDYMMLFGVGHVLVPLLWVYVSYVCKNMLFLGFNKHAVRIALAFEYLAITGLAILCYYPTNPGVEIDERLGADSDAQWHNFGAACWILLSIVAHFIHSVLVWKTAGVCTGIMLLSSVLSFVCAIAFAKSISTNSVALIMLEAVSIGFVMLNYRMLACTIPSENSNGDCCQNALGQCDYWRHVGSCCKVDDEKQ